MFWVGWLNYLVVQFLFLRVFLEEYEDVTVRVGVLFPVCPLTGWVRWDYNFGTKDWAGPWRVRQFTFWSRRPWKPSARSPAACS